MSLPRYPAYKERGVEWLGKVPEHWSIKPMKRLIGLIEQGWSPQCENYCVEGSEGWGVLKVGCVNGGVFRSTENKSLPVELDPRPELAILKDDLLVSRANTRELVGSAAVAGQAYPNLLLCDKIYRLKVDSKEARPQFLSFFLGSREARSQIELEASGASDSMLNISQSVILELPCPAPPAHEQASISTFLDHETAKIDVLIDEQKRLIELLQEKRQAVISHAVTKGLNPDAPMKDSGVEWLGEVPEHWEIKKLKFVSPQITVGIVVEPSKYYVDDGVPALRSLNVSQGKIRLENLVFISENANKIHEKSRLATGDLVAVRSGQPGTTAVIESNLDGCNCVDLIIIRKPFLTSSHFLSWYLASDFAKIQFSSGSGGAIQQHFNVATAAELIIPVPPKEEQADILQVVELRIAQLDLLSSQVQQAVTLLQERRSALISDAVTGQIDVRGLVPEAVAT